MIRLGVGVGLGVRIGGGVSHPDSNLIQEAARRVLRHLIGQICSILTLPLLLTGSNGEYLRVVGIIVMVE